MALYEFPDGLCAQPLPPGLSINNYFQGIGEYSYEDYLWEFVNTSDTFLSKSGGEKYTQPPKEDHGECDCQSSKYSLDFKRFTSQALLQGQNLFSPQFTCFDGVIIESAPRITPKNPKYKPIQATRIFAALRGVTLVDLMAIRNSKINEQPDNDIRHLLKIMEVKKNLLLFFPYNFYYEDVVPFEQGLEAILQALNSDFHPVMQYRDVVRPELDTFLCFLYQKNLILSQWHDNKLQYNESIPIEKSPLFLKILNYASDGFHWNGLK